VNIIEIERLFILKNQDELEQIEGKVISLGFELKVQSSQHNCYYDFPDHRLEKKGTRLRFRYNEYYKLLTSLPKSLDLEIDKTNQLIVIDDYEGNIIEKYNGELSLSKEWFDKDHNDVRDQISFELDNLEVFVDLENIFKKIGFINSFIINKERKEYGLNYFDDFRKSIHIEIDSNILVKSQYPDVSLENTLQICVEKDTLELTNQEIEIFIKKLNSESLELTTKNYFERAKEKLKV